VPGRSAAAWTSTRHDRYDLVVERWGATRVDTCRPIGVPGATLDAEQ